MWTYFVVATSMSRVKPMSRSIAATAIICVPPASVIFTSSGSAAA